MQVQPIENKKIFYLFLLLTNWRRYKIGKIKISGIGSIVGWASAHHFYSFLIVN